VRLWVRSLSASVITGLAIASAAVVFALMAAPEAYGQTNDDPTFPLGRRSGSSVTALLVKSPRCRLSPGHQRSPSGAAARPAASTPTRTTTTASL